jgi:membrane associated rhomboid family serine protease
MGIYDREYYREEPRGGMFADRAMVTNLILINVGVFLEQMIFDQRPPARLDEQPLLAALSLDPGFFQHPWQIWRLLTYGFLHDTENIGHILFNMFGLWFFGREVEGIYGRTEFLRIYLTTILAAGLAWLLVTAATQGSGPLIGASGGVIGIMALWVCHFPRRVIYIWGVLPMPAWALGGLYVFFDIVGLGRHDNVAHVAHLAGAGFGFIYFRTGWNLGRLVPHRWSLSALKIRPRLRIHQPTADERDLTSEVDRILEKISREGEASLSKQERAVLERASRRYQQRRQ